VPREYIPAVEKGVREAADSGVLAGYPVTDLKVALFDGSFHEVDSNEMAFKMAASMAFKEAVHKGAPVLLEPAMRVEVVVPEEFLGDVMGQDQQPPRQHPGHGSSTWQRAGRACHRAARRDVRLRHAAALGHAGQGRVQHGIRPLRAHTAVSGRGNRQGIAIFLLDLQGDYDGEAEV